MYFKAEKLIRGFYLLYTDGTILEYELFKKGIQKTYQTKVAYDRCGYFAFVDEFGGLQIGGVLGKFMVNIHPISKRRTILNGQVLPDNIDFDFKSIRVVIGNFLWILGGGIGDCETGKEWYNSKFILVSTYFLYLIKDTRVVGITMMSITISLLIYSSI